MRGRIILLEMPEQCGSRAALLVDGRLDDLLLDPPAGAHLPRPGEICWAKVERLVPKLGGAFVRLSREHQGFLREAKGLREGQGVLVQVVSYPEPGKASAVTRRVLYKGPRLIHTPGAPGINVSRQIRDEAERERLAAIVAGWKPGPGMAAEPALTWYREAHAAGGFIIRTAAEGASEEELHAELDWVLSARSEREGLTRTASPGTTGTASLAMRDAVREWALASPTEIVASPSCHRVLTASDGLSGSPFLWGSQRLLGMVRREDNPFEAHGVWDEIDRLRNPRVELASGGWMAVEATRAMITVDVNTAGEFSGGAAITANVEAARELPRQLRLRGLGGQVAIDFAPLKKPERKRVEDTLKSAFRRDGIETTLAGWTPLGNFELQRKRERRPLAELLAVLDGAGGA